LQDKDESLFITADTPNNLLNVVGTRSNELINADADYVVSFTTFNPIPTESTIQIAYPKDQIVFGAS